MFDGKGKLHYHTEWLMLYTDDEIGRYYRALLQREHPAIKLNIPKHGAHVTVIAGKYETPSNKDWWGKYEDETISFTYDPEILHKGKYFWLTIECPRIEEIRKELGLPPKIKWPWHLTIGNTKGLDAD
jgi:hypothetical protein